MRHIRRRLVHSDTLCCEPILRRMPNGELLCLCQCEGPKEPHRENHMWAFHSRDNGETWDVGLRIHPENPRLHSLTECLVLGDVVYGFFLEHDGYLMDMTSTVLQSTDNGYTWVRSNMMLPYPRYTLYRGATALDDGNILLPYMHYPVEEAGVVCQQGQGLYAHEMPYVENGSVLLAADGHVLSQSQGPVQIPMPFPGTRRFVWTEPAAFQAPSGEAVMLLRMCDTGILWRTESLDKGMHWAPITCTNIPNPANKVRVIAFDRKEHALLHTPDAKVRFPLALWVSTDGLRTFSEKHVLSDFPGTWHYADGFYEDGHVLAVCEYNRRDIIFFDCSMV